MAKPPVSSRTRLYVKVSPAKHSTLRVAADWFVVNTSLGQMMELRSLASPTGGATNGMSGIGAGNPDDLFDIAYDDVVEVDYAAFYSTYGVLPWNRPVSWNRQSAY